MIMTTMMLKTFDGQDVRRTVNRTLINRTMLRADICTPILSTEYNIINVLCWLHVRGNTLNAEARMKFNVALYQTEEGYSAAVPGLPGCCSQGTTEQEAG